MSINRNNYEEMFLLYVDNELSAAERLSVENFVQENPDLAEELEILKDTVVVPEELIMPGKQTLLNISQAEAGIFTRQEQLLLYVDNELDVEQKLELESRLSADPALQQEFAQLRQAVLPVETLEFRNKEVLYRKQRSAVVTILLSRRLSAAAVVTALMLTGWWMFKPGSAVDPVVKPSLAHTNVIKKQNAEGSVTKQQSQSYNNQQQQTSASATGGVSEHVVVRPTLASDNKKALLNNPQTTSLQVQEDDFAAEELYADLVQPNRPVQPVNKEENERILRQVLSQIPNELSQPAAQQSFVSNEQQPVQLKELQEVDVQSESVMVGGLELNKTKLKGIFKRATRFLGGNKQPEAQGKLQIASFEVETRKQAQ